MKRAYVMTVIASVFCVDVCVINRPETLSNRHASVD